MITLQRVTDPDRTEEVVRFRDSALLGSRVQLDLKVSERSDGHLNALDV